MSKRGMSDTRIHEKKLRPCLVKDLSQRGSIWNSKLQYEPCREWSGRKFESASWAVLAITASKAVWKTSELFTAVVCSLGRSSCDSRRDTRGINCSAHPEPAGHDLCAGTAL